MTKQQSLMSEERRPMSEQQSPVSKQQSPMSEQQSPMSEQQCPLYVQQNLFYEWIFDFITELCNFNSTPRINKYCICLHIVKTFYIFISCN